MIHRSLTDFGYMHQRSTDELTDALFPPFSPCEYPAVIPGKELLNMLYTTDIGSLDPQPCSVDVQITEFKDLTGKRLEYPFVIRPEMEIMGYPWITYTHNNILCAETRSSYARKGLACTGFGSGDECSGFLSSPGEIVFILKNYSPNSYVVERPFSPVQLSATLYNNGRPESVISIEPDAEQSFLHDMRVYATTLADEIAFFRKSSEPLSIHEDVPERLVIRGTLHDARKYMPGFCLGITNERIDSNGCPAYMYPFHPDDVIKSGGIYMISQLFPDIFSNPQCLPVTANAGLINPGNTGKIVYEIITEGRNMKKYLQKGSVFAMVIEVPFSDHSLYENYTSHRARQESIVF